MSSIKTLRKQYQKITSAKRYKLIDLVVQKKYSICRAAVVIGIALSTAKIIVKRFRRDGTIFVRKEQRRIVKNNEEQSQIFESSEHHYDPEENQGSNPQLIPIMPWLTYLPPVQPFLVFYSPQMFFDGAFSGFA